MADDRPATYADSVLDREFFEELGRFVSNCGHLEKVLWILFATIARLDVENEVDVARALQTSIKPFGALISDLRDLINKTDDLPEKICSAVQEMLDDISTDLIYRNLAVHGAWSSNGDHYRVSFFKKIQGEARGNPDSYRAFAAPISLAEIQQASRNASAYLTRALELKRTLEDQRAQQA